MFDMSSDEDFAIVLDFVPDDETEEGLKKLIQSYQERHTQLLAGQRELAADMEECHKLTQKFNQRSQKLTESLKREKSEHQQQLTDQQDKLAQLKEDQSALASAIEKVKAALAEDEFAHHHLKQQADLFQAAPEREVDFHGQMSDATDCNTFDMKAKILYPMEGGTALVTFEEEAAASKVLELKLHSVNLGEDCRITVEAKPVQLLLPRRVQIHTEVSHKQILVSNLPDMDPEILLNKLEIYFSKSRHSGGEIEACELLGDSGTVVVTFLNDNISAGLAEMEFHDVALQQMRMHKVRVTPFLNGQVSDLQNEPTLCPRTVLLTGIPDVMDREGLQDLLEIHFQKSANGGGEIEAFLYNPTGHQAMAQFHSVAEA